MRQNALLAKFFLRAEHVISRIDLLILCGYGLRLLLIAAGKRVDTIIQGSDLLTLLGYLYIFISQLRPKLLDLVGLLFQLRLKLLHHLRKRRLQARISPRR